MPWLVLAALALILGAFGAVLLQGYVEGRKMAGEAVEGEERLH